MTEAPFPHEDKSWDWALKRLATTEIKLQRALTLLREVEYADNSHEEYDAACPYCGGSRPYPKRLDPYRGHGEDCKLAALLEECNGEAGP